MNTEFPQPRTGRYYVLRQKPRSIPIETVALRYSIIYLDVCSRSNLVENVNMQRALGHF